MAAGDFRAPILFGVPGYELSIGGGTTTSNVPPPFEISPERMDTEQVNLQGATYTRVHRRFDMQYTFKVFNATDQIKDAIMSLAGVGNTHLSFIFADQWKVYSERYACDTTTGFAMLTNPWMLHDQAYNAISGTATLSGFTVGSVYGVTGVPLAASIGVSSYTRSTGRIILASAQAVNTVVYMDYAYNGAFVKFARLPQIKQSPAYQSSKRGWDIAMILKGV